MVWALLPIQQFWPRLKIGDCLKNSFEDLFFFFFFGEHLQLCPLVLGLEHSCPWPREGLSSERLFLALASDFFVSLASSIVSSPPPLFNHVYVFAQLILIPPEFFFMQCFKSINFYQNKAKLTLKLISELWKLRPQTSLPSAAGSFAPDLQLTAAVGFALRPPKQPSHCKFPATSL